MGEDSLRKLWALLDAERAAGTRITLPGTLALASSNGIDLSSEQIWTLASRLGRDGAAETACPPAVTSFITDLIGGESAEAVLDPWVGLATLLKPVVQATKAPRFVGLERSADMLEAARLVLPDVDGSQYRMGGCDGSGLRDDESFDFVVSALPFGMERRAFELAGRKLSDEGGNEVLLRSALRLKPNGVGVYVVPASFFFRSEGNSVRAQLNAFELHIDAAFLLPAGTFKPFTMIETYAVVVRRGPAAARMFVAELPSSAERAAVVLKNYRDRRSGRTPELGALVPEDSFTGLGRLIAEHDVDRLTKRMPFPALRLGDLATSITMCPASPEAIVATDNGIFLRLEGVPKAVLSVEELPQRTSRWAHIQLDPSRAEAKLLAGYFESELGELALQRLMVGATVARLPIAEVANVQVWLPNIDTQRQVIEVDQRIRALSDDLVGLRRRLWARLDTVSEVAHSLGKVNRADSYPAWLDTLPFPLASILWSHHTLKQEPLKGYHQLDYFFEGLAQFLAVLCWSAAKRDPEFDTIWSAIRTTLEHGKGSLERATLGTWVMVFEALAKQIRSRLSAEAEHWQRLFACDDKALLEAIVSKAMVNLLKSANERRNEWRGHGGIVGDAEALRRASVYTDMLLDFRRIVEDRWSEYPMLRPINGKFSQGVHRYTVERIIGTRTPFDSDVVEAKEVMEHGMLHMAAMRRRAVLPLLPFVRLGATPANTVHACYFFNRVEKGGAKFISYHFEDRPEIVDDGAEARAIVAELSRAR